MEVDVRFLEGIKEPWQECNVCLLHTRCGASWGLWENSIPDIPPCFRDTPPPYYVEGTPEYEELQRERKRIDEENKKWMKQFLEKY